MEWAENTDPSYLADTEPLRQSKNYFDGDDHLVSSPLSHTLTIYYFSFQLSLCIYKYKQTDMPTVSLLAGKRSKRLRDFLYKYILCYKS